MGPRSARHDLGETLIEVIMAVLLLGLAVVAIVGAVASLIIGSDIHRQQASGTAVLLSAAETMKSASPAYVACADKTDATYAAALSDTTRVPRPAGWPVPVITAVKFWNGTAFQGTCYDTADSGNLLKLQQLTLSITDPKRGVTETISVTKRSAS